VYGQCRGFIGIDFRKHHDGEGSCDVQGRGDTGNGNLSTGIGCYRRLDGDDAVRELGTIDVDSEARAVNCPHGQFDECRHLCGVFDYGVPYIGRFMAQHDSSPPQYGHFRWESMPSRIFSRK